MFEIENKHRAIAQAMATGSTQQLPIEVRASFEELGLAHILCASGGHLLVVAGLCLCLFALLQMFYPESWRGRPAIRLSELALVILAVWAFVWSCEFSRPVLRSGISFSLIACARFLGLGVRIYPCAIFALVFACFGKGSALSLALSSVAALALLRPRKWQEIPYPAWLCIGPWIATSPLVIMAFSLHSGSAPVWNFIFTPLWSCLVAAPGVSALAVSGFFGDSPLSELLWLASAGSAAALFPLQEWVRFRFSLAMSIPTHQWLIATLCLAGFAIYSRHLLLEKLFKIKFIYTIAPLLLLALTLPFCSTWNFAMLNVGQGESLLFRNKTNNDEFFLVDLGPANRGGSSRVRKELLKLGVGKISGILLTHLDQDHRAGLREILDRWGHHSLALWVPCSTRAEKRFLEIARLAEKTSAAIHCLRLGEKTEIFPGLVCLHIAGKQNSSNDASPLCHYTGISSSMSMAGDASALLENHFYEIAPELIQAEIWKISHHGSGSSSDANFLGKLRSREFWISAGAQNRYGHPHPRVLRESLFRGRVRRTDQHGTVLSR